MPQARSMAGDRVPLGQAQQPLQDAHALDATAWHHGLGPAACMCGPRPRTCARSQAAPRSTPLIFSAAMCCACVLNRPGSCLTCTAICSMRSLKMRTSRRVPAHPDLAAQVLRRHRVVGRAHLDVAVAMHDAPALVEEREALGGQLAQGWPSRPRRSSLPTCRRVVPWMRVSATVCFPVAQEVVLLVQAGEDPALQGVLLDVVDAALDLPLVSRRVRSRRQKHRAVVLARTTAPWG